MTIKEYVKYLKNYYKISDAEIASKQYLKNTNTNSILKELIGMKFIKSFNLFNDLFGKCKVEEITDADLQKYGVDFKITTDENIYNIDLKSLVGNYFDEKGFHIPIECITRNDGVTHSTYYMKNGEEKLTDFYLYVCHDLSHLIFYVLLPKEFCLTVAKNTDEKDLCIAKNGHGVYTNYYIEDFNATRLIFKKSA